MTPGSNAIAKGTAPDGADGITWRATMVPVSSRMRAAIATASAERADLSLRVIVPETRPVAAAETG